MYEDSPFNPVIAMSHSRERSVAGSVAIHTTLRHREAEGRGDKVLQSGDPGVDTQNQNLDCHVADALRNDDIGTDCHAP